MKIVTIGASQGLGLSLTRKLLEQGHCVAAGILSITSELKKLQESYPRTLLVFSADVTNEILLQSGAQICKEAFGEFDAICNIAGVLLPSDRTRSLHECNTEELRKTFEVNTIGAVLAIKCFYPLLKTGARFFTVTSEGTDIGNCGAWVPCYSLSKTAETKISGIMNQSVSNADFYSVHPGRMNTEMGRTTAQIEPEESADGFCRLISGETPLCRKSWYIDYQGNSMFC